MSKQVIDLAVEVSNARDSEIPIKLQKIQDLLTSTNDLQKLAEQLYKCNLLKALIISFKYEYGHLRYGWTIAVDLVKIFCECIIVFFQSDKTYQDEFLPLAVENILVLARKFQEKHVDSKAFKDDNLQLFKVVLKEYTKIHTAHPNLIHGTIKSPRFLQLLVTEEVDTAIITINVLKELFQIQKNILFKLNETVINAIVDEVIFKLSTTSVVDLGLSAIQLLLVMCEIDPFFNKYLYKRYKGLKMLMSKWYGKGIGKDLSEFVQLLEKADRSKTEDEKFYKYATTIQKVWRGYKTRKHLKKINSAIAKFQKTFRQKYGLKRESKERQIQQDELSFHLAIEHRRKLRETKLNMAELLQILPPSQIEKYLIKQQNDAAVKIQAVFRGYKQRQKFYNEKELIIQNKAAICIQRVIRRWLERVKRRRDEPAYYSRPESLTSEKREILLERIRVHLDSLPPHPRSDREFNELHEKGQNMFKNYVHSQRDIRKQQQKMQVLLALINHDSQLILNCPKLNEVTEEDIYNFYNHKSLPVMLAAKEAHKDALKKYRSKWHETLLSDSDESDNDMLKNEKACLKGTNVKKSARLTWLEDDLQGIDNRN